MAFDNLTLQPTQRLTFSIGPSSTLEDEFRKLKDDQNKLYVAGGIWFVDIYNQEHYNRFCYSYTLRAINEVMNATTTTLSGQVCEGFNDSD